MRNSQFTTLLLATAFVLMSWSGSWFEITATGTYTEGLEREPTISTHYMIDSDMEAIDITIDNATSLLLYWMEREDVNNGGEQQQPDSNSSESGGDGQAATTSSDEEPCAGSCLDSARSAVRMSMLVFLVVFSASIVRPRLELKLAAVAVWRSHHRHRCATGCGHGLRDSGRRRG